MRKPFLAFVTAWLWSTAGLGADLTPTEMRWLSGIWPVIAFARQSTLPLDIVVQPQPAPGAAPLAMAFIDGRCKLVLSMRGNVQAQATLDRIEPELLDAALELMAAHELGHCRRYLDGAWQSLPAGFSGSICAAGTAECRAAYANMQAARREEAYADLVGLAWIRQRHAQQYDKLHAWLVQERSSELIPGSHHDTLAWLRLAGSGHALQQPSIFSAAAALWKDGLAAE